MPDLFTTEDWGAPTPKDEAWRDEVWKSKGDVGPVRLRDMAPSHVQYSHRMLRRSKAIGGWLDPRQKRWLDLFDMELKYRKLDPLDCPEENRTTKPNGGASDYIDNMGRALDRPVREGVQPRYESMSERLKKLREEMIPASSYRNPREAKRDSYAQFNPGSLSTMVGEPTYVVSFAVSQKMTIQDGQVYVNDFRFREDVDYSVYARAGQIDIRFLRALSSGDRVVFRFMESREGGRMMEGRVPPSQIPAALNYRGMVRSRDYFPPVAKIGDYVITQDMNEGFMYTEYGWTAVIGDVSVPEFFRQRQRARDVALPASRKQKKKEEFPVDDPSVFGQRKIRR